MAGPRLPMETAMGLPRGLDVPDEGLVWDLRETQMTV